MQASALFMLTSIIAQSQAGTKLLLTPVCVICLWFHFCCKMYVRALYDNKQSSAEFLVQIYHHLLWQLQLSTESCIKHLAYSHSEKGLNLLSLFWSHLHDCNNISKLYPTVNSYLPA